MSNRLSMILPDGRQLGFAEFGSKEQTISSRKGADPPDIGMDIKPIKIEKSNPNPRKALIGKIE